MVPPGNIHIKRPEKAGNLKEKKLPVKIKIKFQLK